MNATAAKKTAPFAVAVSDLAIPASVASKIALKHLSLETLETRNSDSLDFHDVGVASLRDALAAAYRAGFLAGASK